MPCARSNAKDANFVDKNASVERALARERVAQIITLIFDFYIKNVGSRSGFVCFAWCVLVTIFIGVLAFASLIAACALALHNEATGQL
jgi:hypothetical protein